MTRLSSSRRILGSGATALALAATSFAPGAPVQAQMAVPDDHRPIVAEVAADSVSVYAYPKKDSVVRRQVATGDLLRVTGQAPGIDGDSNTWIATTEGFVESETLQPASSEPAQAWTLPDTDLAPHGWWGSVTSEANVRAMPSGDSPRVGVLSAGTKVKVLAEEHGTFVDGTDVWYRIDGGRFAGGRVHSTLITKIDQPSPNTTAPDPAPADGSWITVDRAARTLTLVQSGNPVFVTFVAIGKTGVETPTGRYGIVNKLPFDDMASARNPTAEHSYYLPNVPNVQYFTEDGSAIHGTYWHDSYGTEESQGCINLTITDAAYLYGQTSSSTVVQILD